MTNDTKPPVEVSMACAIVMAYVEHNSLPASEVAGLIASTHAAIVALSAPAAEPEADHRASASDIRKSITPDHLVSFIDGKPYKSLKRHLTANGYTPETYRQKFGLGAAYPMTSEAYSAQRSQLAKDHGLGLTRNRSQRLVA